MTHLKKGLYWGAVTGFIIGLTILSFFMSMSQTCFNEYELLPGYAAPECYRSLKNLKSNTAHLFRDFSRSDPEAFYVVLLTMGGPLIFGGSVGILFQFWRHRTKIGN